MDKFQDYLDISKKIKNKYKQENVIILYKDDLFYTIYEYPHKIIKIGNLLNCQATDLRKYNLCMVGFSIISANRYLNILYQHYSIVCIQSNPTENWRYIYDSSKTIITELYSPNFKKKLIEQVYSYKILSKNILTIINQYI